MTDIRQCMGLRNSVVGVISLLLLQYGHSGYDNSQETLPVTILIYHIPCTFGYWCVRVCVLANIIPLFDCVRIIRQPQWGTVTACHVVEAHGRTLLRYTDLAPHTASQIRRHSLFTARVHTMRTLALWADELWAAAQAFNTSVNVNLMVRYFSSN